MEGVVIVSEVCTMVEVFSVDEVDDVVDGEDVMVDEEGKSRLSRKGVSSK